MEFDLEPDLAPVACLPGEINQVFLNIIVNAAHAIADRLESDSDQGTISISSRALGEEVEIRIRDTGTGISEEVQKRMFDPFFTTKGVGKGTGQGLAIAHAVITQKHHGTIAVESEQGVGTTFVIRLPFKQAAESKQPA